MKRKSWFQALAGRWRGAPIAARLHKALADLDNKLFNLWALGEKIILVWTQDRGTLVFLAVQHHAIVEVSESGALTDDVLSKPKYVEGATLDAIRSTLGAAAEVLRVPFRGIDETSRELINSLVTRYSVTLVPARAVVLLDVVGFSLKPPLHQVVMLNSLGYSVNAAYGQLLSTGIDINFARTTTGDGFYIWNRSRNPEADAELYKLMMLILADNALAQREAAGLPVPALRAAFHVGRHYEFYQVEGLNPTTFGYIVGQVTIELARMIEKALPGQIVVGDFTTSAENGLPPCDTPTFVKRTAVTLDQLQGLSIGEDRVRAISCYLTGPPKPNGDFTVNRYAIEDKHGQKHFAYNAKVNIHPVDGEPLFLGVQHKELQRRVDFPWPVI